MVKTLNFIKQLKDGKNCEKLMDRAIVNVVS
jgi:hypothetical protein